ncbi:hypothetical protein [Mycolicibacterium hippocampi]|uniref:Uncharacterized protein n=1 Tax=Mycolicibacterium hippocampi TaxID=659824 RepID=A0A850PQ82_9MYCO|nr:hypothetical protein [Mycolicibacterium hippocampi]NVN50653.1 hypothetical protein [Mycolicibacterium hippocampi]
MRTPIRHGEILLLPVAAAPDGPRVMAAECIVGHSESGHHHVLEGDVEFAQVAGANGELYVALDTPTPLRHRKSYQQHRELLVPAGVWRIIRKTEFDVRSMPPIPDEAPVRDTKPAVTPPKPAIPQKRSAVRLVRD